MKTGRLLTQRTGHSVADLESFCSKPLRPIATSPKEVNDAMSDHPRGGPNKAPIP
jgi:hypothetical protein